MGFNTGVLICNDALHLIESHKEEFVTNMVNAIHLQSRGKEGDSIDFNIQNHIGYGTVFWQSHADNTGVFAIGGNYATHLGTYYRYSHHSLDDRLAILQKLASDMGFEVVPKARKQKKKLSL